MEDEKLERMHNDLKRSSELRGKRGGLGKIGSSKVKRIQIDYIDNNGEILDVEEEEEKEKLPATVSKPQPFIKFVPAKRKDQETNKEKEQQSRDVSKKKESKQSYLKIFEFVQGEELLSNIADMLSEDLKQPLILASFGSLSKATVVNDLTKEKVKLKEQVSILKVEFLPEYKVKIDLVREHNGKIEFVSGRLKKGKVGDSGLKLLVSAST